MSKNFFKTETAKAVIFLAVILAIVGAISFFMFNASPSQAANTYFGSTQEIQTTVTTTAYVPSVLTVSPGANVRWILDASKAQGCIRSLVVPSLKISKLLIQGQNVIEFTAPKSGSIPFRCSMGMYKGVINVK